ncbi:MAG: acetyl-CoA C-acetyltransferase [Planctomycetes bacterium]|nr:acetyl-CoA C-acetyltransferase [Planctomycetota bacterium]
MSNPVIVGGKRTAIGKFLGGLSSIEAPQLGAVAIKAAIADAGIEASAIEECIMGNVCGAGIGQNPARQAARVAGLPDAIGSFTINKVCGSGLKAVMLAAQAIKAGDANAIVAGGMESMSNVPFYVNGIRNGVKMGNQNLIDGMIVDGLWDKYYDFHMGMTGEAVAEKYDVSREAQDKFAASSHAKAAKAIADGIFAREIVSVSIPQRKGDPVVFDVDEAVRADTTQETLSKLRPAFKKDGTVTAGNAPGVNDGAAALVVMSESRAKELGAQPCARILGYATGGVDPKWVMMAPVEAIKNLNRKLGTKVGDFDLFELNEAFSVQALACTRETGIDPEKVNILGGAVALGHPIGASGARVLVTLMNALETRGKTRGVAALCLGGGNAVAMAIELV